MKKATIPTMQFTWWAIRYNPWSFMLWSVSSIYLLVIPLVPGLIMRAFFDRLTGDATINASRSGYWAIWSLVALFVAVESTRVLSIYGTGYSDVAYRDIVKVALRRNILAGILRRPGASPLAVTTGEALNRLDDDVSETADFPLWLPWVVGHLGYAVVAIAIMLAINPMITLAVCIPLIAVIVVTQIAWSRMLGLYKGSRESDEAVTGFLGEILGAVQAIKIADAERGVIHHLGVLNENRRRTNLRLRVTREFIYTILDHMSDLAVGFTLLLGASAMQAGTFSVGDFALFVSYLGFVTQIPTLIGTFIGDYQTQAISIQRMEEMIEVPANGVSAPAIETGKVLIENHPIYLKSEPPTPELPIHTVADRLEYLKASGLSYKFPGTENGISNVDLTVRRGAFTVITGRVGSGKTTFIRVLLGLLPRQGGEIRWNDQVVSDPGSFFCPPRCAYTAQVPRLFSDTLRENILLGLPEAEVKLSSAISMAVLEGDIQSFEKGLDTVIGPKGVRLSGGQVQRTAAARMFVRQTELLVFDDLSSALDVETENLLWERLNQKRHQEGTTCLIVSHRRTVLKQADQIILLKDGAVEAVGRLDELLESSEEMREIWRAESKE